MALVITIKVRLLIHNIGATRAKHNYHFQVNGSILSGGTVGGTGSGGCQRPMCQIGEIDD